MIKAIKNSLNRHLAWPAKRFLIAYSLAAIALALYAAAGFAFSSGPPELSVSERLGGACLLSLVTLFAASVFYLELAFFYRIVLEVIVGWKKFRAWLPCAITSTRAGLYRAGQAILALLHSIVGLPGATVRLLRRLRLPTAKEVLMGFMMASGFAIAGGIGYLFWPLASKIALGMPTWLPGSAKDSSDIVEILLVDVLLSCFPYAIALSLWSSLIMVLVRRFKSKS